MEHKALDPSAADAGADNNDAWIDFDKPDDTPSCCRSKPAKRKTARQNLLVAAVNAALERGLLTLECAPVEAATFEFTIGPYPVIAHVPDASSDEVLIQAIVRPTELGRQTVACAVLHGWQKFGAATTFAWLERRTGKYLQSGVNYHGTKTVTRDLSDLTISPRGFGTRPTKYGYDYFRECEAVFGWGRR